MTLRTDLATTTDRAQHPGQHNEVNQAVLDLQASKGQPNGLATLDNTGRVPAGELPSGAVLDPDLVAIGGLSPADDDVLQRKAGAWTTRTPGQLRADLAIIDPPALDPDLVAIGGLSPADDDLIQRKGGTWTSRTPAQVKADLGVVAGGGGGGSFLSAFKWGVD